MMKLIVNDEKFNQALEQFKVEFSPNHWQEEKYKWQAVKCFQDNWDINALDFREMFTRATEGAKNLLSSINYLPRGMIQEFAKVDPEFVRSMFINLFDETMDLAGRVAKFISDAEAVKEKYNTGLWKNHYQTSNSISTYLWLRYPDKYYIYKYTIYREVANLFGSDFIPKKGYDIQNLTGGFKLYDEICERLKKDNEIKSLLSSYLDDSCYDDLSLKTLTIDFGYVISRNGLMNRFGKKIENWFPLDYSPEISVNKWVDLLNSPEVFTPSSLEIMKRIKDYGGAATCKQLSLKYGESVNFYNAGSSALAKRVAQVTGCNTLSNDNENSKWWPILYYGRYADNDSEGIFVWKLRDELSKALDKVDLSSISLYKEKDRSPRIWKVSQSPDYFNKKEYEYCEEQRVIVVNKNTKAKGQSKTSQGEDFMNEMQQGDYFYLCYGNSIRLLGKIIDNEVVQTILKSNGWYQRHYEIVKLSSDLKPFVGESKWWTPNHNSTFIEIEESNYLLFEESILKPYFNMTLSDLTKEVCSNKSYWWLNASPKIWSFADISIGEEINYTLYNDNGNKRRVFQNFLDAKAGDTIICYESNPTKKIVAIGKVSKENDGKNIYFEKTEVLVNPIDYATIRESPELAKMEYFTNPNGSLFKLTKNEFEYIMDIIREENPAINQITLTPYSKDKFLEEVYMLKGRYEILVNLLKRKKNIILQGAPGVGKTFAAKRLAYSIMGVKDDSKIVFVQFHQNYSYEDFIMGYRPEGSGFELKYGIFYRFCQKAASQPEKEFFFIIDEINRGNLSKIFGELLMLIEKDYRGEKTTLAYNGLSFSVPKNLYIIGMMNTADRSLAMMDYALRRRFSFFEVAPAFDSDGFNNYKDSIENETFNLLIERIKELNQDITKELGAGFCIGHSYFCGQEICSEDWLREIVEYDIIPMLSEYWFDDNEKLLKWENILRGVFND